MDDAKAKLAQVLMESSFPRAGVMPEPHEFWGNWARLRGQPSGAVGERESKNLEYYPKGLTPEQYDELWWAQRPELIRWNFKSQFSHPYFGDGNPQNIRIPDDMTYSRLEQFAAPGMRK